jgi:hypothetical protein
MRTMSEYPPHVRYRRQVTKVERQPWSTTTPRTSSPTRLAPPLRSSLPCPNERVGVSQLDARQLLYDYVDGLRADITRTGERPAVGNKYQAIVAMRELTGGAATIAF